MGQALERFRKCRSRKPSRLIRREMRMSQSFWGCKPLHYLRYNLYQSDKPLTASQILSYIPEFFFYSLFLPYYDSEEYSIVIRDKILTEQVFRSVGIRQPLTLGKIIHGRLYDSNLREIPYTTLLGALQERNARKVFVKPADGQGGHGIKIFTRNPEGKYLTEDDESLSSEFLLRLAVERDYIIQPGIVQAPSMSAIYPCSVNTFRVATENISGRVRVLCSTIRSGRAGRQVDNSAQDGIVIGIDIHAGTMLDTASTETCETFAKHPDTGFTFAGHLIPRWDDVVRFATDSASRLPQFTYLGWDIAMSEDGPLAIETNLGFGLDHYQVAIGGLQEIFGITDPNFYWRHRRPGR